MSVKTRLAQLEKRRGDSDEGSLHHHVQIVDENGVALRSFCGREAWHGRRCVGAPGIVLILPDNGRDDASFWP